MDLDFAVLEFQHGEKLEGGEGEDAPGAGDDGHAKGHGIGRLVIDDLLELDTLVIHYQLCHLVDGSQILQSTIGVDVKMVELHVPCEIFLQHRSLSLQRGFFHQTPHHIRYLPCRVLHFQFNSVHLKNVSKNCYPTNSRSNL